MFLKRYDPFEQLDRLFTHDWVSFPTIASVSDNVNITKDKTAAHIQLNAVGFKKDEVEVEVANDILTVRGKLAKEANGRGYFAKNFEYSWSLSEKHDKSKIESGLEDGILNIMIPFKTPDKKTEDRLRIEIK